MVAIAVPALQMSKLKLGRGESSRWASWAGGQAPAAGGVRRNLYPGQLQKAGTEPREGPVGETSVPGLLAERGRRRDPGGGEAAAEGNRSWARAAAKQGDACRALFGWPAPLQDPLPYGPQDEGGPRRGRTEPRLEN